MSLQPNTIEFTLPTWLNEHIEKYTPSPDLQERMSFVIEASRRNVLEQTGGPFAAAVFETRSGRLVSLGVNLVTTQGMSILHAELVALAMAQKLLHSYDLGTRALPEHELVTSSEPCAMCYGAIPWSGVRRVVTGARDADVRSIGFDEGPKIDAWKDGLEKRGIRVAVDIERNRAARVLQEYAEQGGRIYNARSVD